MCGLSSGTGMNVTYPMYGFLDGRFELWSEAIGRVRVDP
jgi:hypothetical protein